MEQTQVDPAALRALSGLANRLADDLATAATAMRAGGGDLASRLPGWALTSATSALAAGIWAEDAAAQAARLGATRDALSAAAGAYAATDDANRLALGG